MAFYDKFPYTNFQELNLDELIKKMVALEEEQQDFINNNVIKYANPIAWDITTQYEANTVVTDSSGNAYISSQPVPTGVNITNTAYWSKIGNFDALWTSIKESIAAVDLGTGSTVPVAIAEGGLIWQSDKLYQATTALPIGTAIAVGSNVQLVTIEDLITALQTGLNTATGNISTLQTDVGNNTNDITALQGTVSGHTTDITNLQNTVNNIVVATAGDPVNVLTLGVKNDGSEDAAAIINTYTAQYDLYFPAGTYLLDSPITPEHSLIGAGNTRIEPGLTILQAHFAGNSKGVIDFEDSVTVDPILIADLCIECSYNNGYGINYVPDHRILTEIRNVTISNNKNWAVNISPQNNTSRPVYINNMSIKADGNNGGNGIYLNSNAGDCEITDLEMMYVDCGIRNYAYMLRLSNAHLFGGRTTTSTTEIDQHWPTTIGIDSYGSIYADNLYLDSFFQCWVQRSANGACGNLICWFDSWMSGAARTDGTVVRAVEGANLSVNNLTICYCPYVSTLYAANVQVKSLVYRGITSISNINAHGSPRLYPPCSAAAYPNYSDAGSYNTLIGAVYISTSNAGNCEFIVSAGSNEVYTVTAAPTSSTTVSITVTRISGYRTLYWKKLANGVAGIYIANITNGYGLQTVTSRAGTDCSPLNLTGCVDLETPHQSDTSGLTAFTLGTATAITVY